MTYTACSVPWQDGPETWHLGTYSVCDDGSYSYDALSDGNHETVDELPEQEEEYAAWRAYHRYCLETGTDPLRAYLCKPYVQKLSEWQAHLRQSNVGLVLIGVRRRGRGPWLPPEDAPDKLLEYLHVERKGQRLVYRTNGREGCAAEMVQQARRDMHATVQASAAHEVKLKCKISEFRDRSNTKAYANEVRQAARAALQVA